MIAIVTGSLGLVGSEAVKFLSNKFDYVIGIDNNQREKFFGTSVESNFPTIYNCIYSIVVDFFKATIIL